MSSFSGYSLLVCVWCLLFDIKVVNLFSARLPNSFYIRCVVFFFFSLAFDNMIIFVVVVVALYQIKPIKDILIFQWY